MENEQIDRSILENIYLKHRINDYEYWRKQSYEFRLSTLEQIRQEYNTRIYEPKQKFQKVIRVINLKDKKN